MKNAPQRRPRPHGAQRGIALIEALVGMLIFAFGVLGLVGLQASMTKAQTSAKYRADAGNLASEVLGLMWADLAANVPTYAGSGCAGYTRCKDWLGKVNAQLPGSQATIVVTTIQAANLATTPPLPAIFQVEVEIAWTQSGGDGGHRYTTEARVEIL